MMVNALDRILYLETLKDISAVFKERALCLNDRIDRFPEYRMEPLTPEVEPVQFHK